MSENCVMLGVERGANPCVERTGTSRPGHLHFVPQGWLVPAAHARRWAYHMAHHA